MDILTFLNSLPKDLSGFFAFIGTAIFASFIVSEVLEKIPQFVEANSTLKTGIVLALNVALGLLSFGLVHWVPPQVVENLQPIYSVLIATAMAFLGGQFWHNTQHKIPAAVTTLVAPPDSVVVKTETPAPKLADEAAG